MSLWSPGSLPQPSLFPHPRTQLNIPPPPCSASLPASPQGPSLDHHPPWGSCPSAITTLWLLHSSGDVASILHQLEPVILHYPPRDGRLTRPQAAVKNVVPTVHWRRNTPCGLRMLSLGWLCLHPASPEGEGAAGPTPAEQGRMVPASDALAHCPGCTRRHKLYCSHTLAPGALCLLLTGSKGEEKEQVGGGQAFCMPGSLLHPQGQPQQRARQGRGLYPASGCCDTDTNSRGTGDDFSFRC